MSTCNSEIKRILELENANLISVDSRIEHARTAAKEARSAAEGSRIVAEGAAAYLDSLIELKLATQEQIDRLKKLSICSSPIIEDNRRCERSSNIDLGSIPTEPKGCSTPIIEDNRHCERSPTLIIEDNSIDQESSEDEKSAHEITDNKEIKYDPSNIVCKFNDLCFYHPDNYQNKPALLFTDANPEFNSSLFYMCKFKHTKSPRSLCFNPKCEGNCNLLHAPTKHMWCKYATTCLYAPENIKKINSISFTQKHVCWKMHATEAFGFKKLCPQVFKNKCRNINCKYLHSDHLS